MKPKRIVAIVSLLALALAPAVEPPPTLLFAWGSLGSGDGQFNYPHGVEVDGAGNVYVADSSNDRYRRRRYRPTDVAYLRRTS